jgi:ubiquinone biosynthesis protein COQ9
MFKIHRIIELLERIDSNSKQNLEETKKMAITITEIKTSLDGLVTVVQTAVEYIKSLDDQLAAAIAAQADPAVLQAISDEIATATTTLSAAIPAPPAA